MKRGGKWVNAVVGVVGGGREWKWWAWRGKRGCSGKTGGNRLRADMRARSRWAGRRASRRAASAGWPGTPAWLCHWQRWPRATLINTPASLPRLQIRATSDTALRKATELCEAHLQKIAADYLRWSQIPARQPGGGLQRARAACRPVARCQCNNVAAAQHECTDCKKTMLRAESSHTGPA